MTTSMQMRHYQKVAKINISVKSWKEIKKKRRVGEDWEMERRREVEREEEESFCVTYFLWKFFRTILSFILTLSSTQMHGRLKTFTLLHSLASCFLS